MNDTQDRTGQLLASLRQSDYRMTPQRMALVRLIAESDDHPSAAQLYAQIRLQFPSMSLATVYKTLGLLRDLGEVFEISLRDDRHYDGSRPAPHPHLICIRCQKIVDGDLDTPVRRLVAEMEQTSGFRIVWHQLNFYGLCPECKQSKNSVNERSKYHE